MCKGGFLRYISDGLIFEMNLDVERELRPRFRLFLSVDLVGSTSLKNKISSSQSIASLVGGLSLLDELENPWFSVIQSFFMDFPQLFNKCAIDIYSTLRGAESAETIPNINLWKMQGDEIIFSIDVSNSRHIIFFVIAFVNSIAAYKNLISSRADKNKSPVLLEDFSNSKVLDSNLDLKGTAWVAGFPATNRELFTINEHMISEDPIRGEDPFFRNLYYCSVWMGGDDHGIFGSPQAISVDFVGPSIDTGFRLCQVATPRKLVVSIELAYIIMIQSGLIDEYNRNKSLNHVDFHLNYSDRLKFKGVLAEARYPIFWIETKSVHALDLLEDKIKNRERKVESAVGIDFCKEFFDVNAPLIHAPQILTEREKVKDLGGIPVHVKDYILRMNDSWISEKGRIQKKWVAVST